MSQVPKSWIAATARAAAPGVLVLVGLAFGGWLGLPAAAVAAVVLVAGVALVCWRPAQELDRAARQIARLAAADPGDAALAGADSTLGPALRTLERSWRDRMNRLREERDAARHVVDAVPDPLMLIDHEREVVRANRAAKLLFETDPTGLDIAGTLRHPMLLQAIDDALFGNGAQAVDITLPVPIERRYAARVEPVATAAGPDEKASRSGEIVALVLLQDLTALHRGERMHSDFVANVSHELRTPLSSLAGFIETLQGPAREDAGARVKFLAIMRDQTDRMTRLISDLLSLSRIEMEEHRRPTGSVALKPLLESIRDTLQIKAADRNMPIELTIPQDIPPAVGDRDQLLQVFQNLVDNAVKYGRPGTPVRVSAVVKPDGGSIAVAVADSSGGIAREHIPRLTERFYRVDTARSRALGGTGLGLAIVKHIVNRHRGTLSIESREGEGSTFTVSLPAAGQQRDE